MTINEEFFEWMYQLVEGKKYSRLLMALHEECFDAINHLDTNRMVDATELRYKFGDFANIPYTVIDKKFDMDYCSVLEVMLGLSVRIEGSIMADSDFGDRTAMWFWMMVKSLGLYNMTNDNFDEYKFKVIMDNFINRTYAPNGAGSLFTVHNTNKDMRDIEIWYQMCLFFDNLI